MHLPTTIRVAADSVDRHRNEQGMNTAEYAVGTVGACGFAGILYQILTSDWGQDLLRNIFDRVLTHLPF